MADAQQEREKRDDHITLKSLVPIGSLPHVRGVAVGILSLIFALCVWIIIGYLNWMNEDDPDGVLPRGVAAANATEAPRFGSVRYPRRLIVIVVDGLRADYASEMGSLNALAARGADLRIDVGFPTYSRGVYAVLSSGSRQDRNGIRTNAFHGPATVDSFWERSRDGGLIVHGVSNLNWWAALFPGGFDRYLVTTLESFRPATEAMLEAESDIVLIHPTHVDYAGHQRGAMSAAYFSAAMTVDRLIADVLDEWVDLEQDTVFVLSDHGHRDKGGHGGNEPEVRFVRGVAAGRGIARRDDQVELGAEQLAATWSILMGVEYPWDAEGEPLFELLNQDVFGASLLESRREGWRRQLRGYLIGLALRSDVSFDPEAGFESWREGMLQARREGRAIRLGLAAAGLLLGFLLILTLRRDRGVVVLISALTFISLFVLAALLTGNATSLSAPEREYRYLLRIFSLGMFAFIGQLMAMRFLKVRDWDTVVMLGAWACVATVVMVLAFYGIPLTPPLPAPPLMFWPLFGSLMACAQAGTGGVLLTLLWLSERLRHWRLKRAGLATG